MAMGKQFDVMSGEVKSILVEVIRVNGSLNNIIIVVPAYLTI
jgi:hypothetical protein